MRETTNIFLKRSLQARLAGCYTVSNMRVERVAEGYVVVYRATPTPKVNAPTDWRVAYFLYTPMLEAAEGKHRIVWDHPARETT